MRVFFVRHGETNANLSWDTVPLNHNDVLNEAGLKRAREIAETLAKQLKRPARLIASPLTRAQQTGEVISKATGLSLETDDRLHEVDYGKWNTRPINDIRRDLSSLTPEIQVTHTPAGGESWLACGTRIAAVIEDASATDCHDLVLISHKHPIISAINVLLKHTPRTWEVYDVPTGSVTLIELHEPSHWAKPRTL